MSATRHFTTAQAREIGSRLGVNWTKIDLEQLRRGLEVELEHGAHDPQTDVTKDDVDLTGRIAWAHLKEIPDYYTQLDAMEAGATALRIDRFLPRYDVTYVCETSVDAPPGDTYAAMKETDLRDPIVNTLFALRELPVNALRRLRGQRTTVPVPEKITFGGIGRQSPVWVRLFEAPGVELVIGSVGRFWRRDYGTRTVAPEAFVAFAEPGYAKLGISLSVRPTPNGSILRYEARTATTDETARRKFRLYWRIIAPGVGLVMRRALKRIKTAAERPVEVGV
ncbi:MAG TPA: DUF5661 family protein [Gemmatimonadales bacterium]|nr:DUF5661 family protein [Gemmatimonadales bacterium]